MRIVIVIALIFSVLGVFSNTPIKGKVFDKKQVPLPGVNVFIEGSYDGGSSNEQGVFSFTTDLKPPFVLKASFVGYKTWGKTVAVSDTVYVEIVLLESVNSLEAVTITAGVFAAADKKRASVMEPLDIYTTASANGDVMAAMRTMPGTQAASDDGRLMVRGGDAYETKTYIDGVLAAKPYFSQTPDVATRGRFAPSLFEGVMFNSGGYSAEFGQALSSVLVLNSTDVALEDNTGVSLMTIGPEMSQTWALHNSSLMISGSYTNLYFYNKILKSNLNWVKPVESSNFTAVYRLKPTLRSLLKIFSTYDRGDLEYAMKFPQQFNVRSKTRTSYSNAHYRNSFSEKTVFNAGIAATFENRTLIPGTVRLHDRDRSVEARFNFSHHLADGFKLLWGASDTYMNEIKEIGLSSEAGDIQLNVEDHTLGTFVESEIHLSKNLAFRPGLRAEYVTVLDRFNLAPRLALALKTSEKSQISGAWGHYYQNPESDYLKFNTHLDFERAEHYVISYQWGSLKERILRAELYQKQYRDLVLWDGTSSYTPQNLRNGGSGYAAGLDLFWRDRKTIKNLDYWITYSFVDTKRQYQNYPERAQPHFIAKHTASAVGKYWVNAISTQFGASFTVASGRNYDDVATAKFMDGRTKPYSDLSLNLSKVFYLGNQYSVLYCSVTNVFGAENIVGYRSVYDSSDRSNVAMIPLQADIKRFWFVGLMLNF
jgi:hypothetical protein